MAALNGYVAELVHRGDRFLAGVGDYLSMTPEVRPHVDDFRLRLDTLRVMVGLPQPIEPPELGERPRPVGWERQALVRTCDELFDALRWVLPESHPDAPTQDELRQAFGFDADTYVVPNWGLAEIHLAGLYKAASALRRVIHPDPPAAPPTAANERREAAGKPQKVRTNALMMDIITKNPEAMGWTISQWQKATGRSRDAIHSTATWKGLAASHKLAKAERALSKRPDRRHRKKPSQK